jgi:predicted dehydrogenase
MKIGIIGLDSSHAVMFARFFNEQEKYRLGRVVAAWPGGSRDVALSAERVRGFTQQVRNDYGVNIVATVQEVSSACDALLLLSMDGRTRAAQFEAIARDGLRVYVNKPLATTSADAQHIARIAARTGVRWFSASMLRFVDGLNGRPRHAEASCPLWWDGGANAGWFWYGMHGIELIHTVMGPGVQSVAVRAVGETNSIHGAGCETLTLRWADGRHAILHGVLDQNAPYMLALDGGAAREISLPAKRFEQATAHFLATGEPPVANAETLEIIRCVEAANESRSTGGRKIPL